MYFFSRQVTLQGSPRKTMPLMSEILAYVNAHSDVKGALWSALFGAPLGSVAYTARFDSLAAIGASNAKLLGDAGYLDLIEKAQEYIAAPPQDTLRQLVHGTAGAIPAVGSVATVITVTAQGGRQADAIGWGIEIADYVSSKIGVPVLFLTDAFGTIGQVTWISVNSDMAAVDKSNAALAADAEYMKRLGAVGDLFQQGSGRSALTTRVA